MRPFLLLLVLLLAGCASSKTAEDEIEYFDPVSARDKALRSELMSYYNDCLHRNAGLFNTFDATWVDMFCRQEANERMQDKCVRRR